jgi:2,4-dienoyl-CoA reductase-like NADH-dependent reductase (Old Yellow Enzyme family)
MKDGSDKIPKLFTPLKLRGVEFQNRIAVRRPGFVTHANAEHTEHSSPHFANTLPKMDTTQPGTIPTSVASFSADPA